MMTTIANWAESDKHAAETADARRALADIDAQMQQLRDLQSSIRQAEQERLAAQAAGDDMAAAVAQQKFQRLARAFGDSEKEIGRLSGERTTLIENFVASGPRAREYRKYQIMSRLDWPVPDGIQRQLANRETNLRQAIEWHKKTGKGADGVETAREEVALFQEIISELRGDRGRPILAEIRSERLAELLGK